MTASTRILLAALPLLATCCPLSRSACAITWLLRKCLPFQRIFLTRVGRPAVRLHALERRPSRAGVGSAPWELCRPPQAELELGARRDFSPALPGRCLEAGFRWPPRRNRVCVTIPDAGIYHRRERVFRERSHLKKARDPFRQ